MSTHTEEIGTFHPVEAKGMILGTVGPYVFGSDGGALLPFLHGAQVAKKASRLAQASIACVPCAFRPKAT